MSKVLSLRTTLGPLFFILCCPPLAILIWYTNTEMEGSILSLIAFFQKSGFFQGMKEIWGPVFWGSEIAWKMIFIFALFQLFLMKLLPGKTFYGPLTPKGNIPVYKANGPQTYAVTLSVFCLCTFVFKIFPATLLYDHLGEMIGALNVFSLGFCALLYVKGRWSPSSTDSGTTGNPLFDYYWGTELYPRLFGWDLKMFTNCRFGMMSWGLLLLSYAAKQQELYGLSNAMILSLLLQFFYLTKFYFWETG
jgi:7-dehydrocholesterol reductase